MFLKRCFVTSIFAFLLAGALLAGAYGSVQAAPPAPIDIPLTQPDGARITARQWGDEWQHGLETPDGYSIIEAANGYWVYAAVDTGGDLAPVIEGGKMLVAGQDAPAAAARHARPTNANRSLRESASALQGAARSLAASNTGTQPLLLVLVEFANVRHTYAASTFESRFFGESNSIVDYYETASFNQLTFTPPVETYGTANDGVIGWLHLAGNFSSSLDWTEIARAGLTAADRYIDYSVYDADGDGYVTSTELHTLILVAGYEQSFCGYSCQGVWAHQSSVQSLTLDGVSLASDSPDGDDGGYAMFGEIHGSEPAYPDHPATIGVMVHELGHDLSWPDLYDANYDTDGIWSGVGKWSIMGSGSWNYVSGVTEDGGTPALPDAWLKAYQGWISPSLAATGSTYNLPAAGANPYALQLGENAGGIDWDFYQKSGTGEYWLVENRQLSGYDAGLPGCGILIWHVDETVTPYNSANGDPDKPLVALEEADGQGYLYNYYGRGDSGDAYPGSSNNRVFGNFTNPNSRDHTNGYSGHTVNILSTGCSDTMQAKYTAENILMNARVYLPVVASLTRSTPYSGKVTYQGAPWAGIALNMAYSADYGSTWDQSYASTTTDAQGNFSFPFPPGVGDNKRFVVFFDNPMTNPAYLWYFECTLVDDLSDGYTCNIELEDIGLLSPGDGSSVGAAVPFNWQMRPVTTDVYHWRFYNGYNTSTYSKEVGYRGSTTINFCDFPTGYWNNWWMDVQTPSGYGIGYDANKFQFSTMQSCSPAMSAQMEKLARSAGNTIADAPLLTWLLNEGKMKLPGR